MIHAFGDSFVQGYQDGPVDAATDIYERNSVSFVSCLGHKFANHAIRGSSNFVQLDKLISNLDIIKSSDIILFGFSSSFRDRYSATLYYPELLQKDKPQNLVWRNIAQSPRIISSNDFYFVNSTLNEIEKQYNLKIIRFNSFENQLVEIQHKLDVGNFIGKDLGSNTLFDVVNGTYGLQARTKELQVREDKQHLFTKKNHPNKQGHALIAEWFLSKEFF